MTARATDRWHFLTAPYDRLMEQHVVKAFETPCPDMQYQTVVKPGYATRVVTIPSGLPPLEGELAVRGLVAASFGVDVHDWPVPLRLARPV